ncbi:hypothetical protein IGI04_013282, partial [Brassica rapa subsp. trilocularis]
IPTMCPEPRWALSSVAYGNQLQNKTHFGRMEMGNQSRSLLALWVNLLSMLLVIITLKERGADFLFTTQFMAPELQATVNEQMGVFRFDYAFASGWITMDISTQHISIAALVFISSLSRSLFCSVLFIGELNQFLRQSLVDICL